MNDKELKQYRRDTYPAFLVKVSEVIGVEPYFLMPLWYEAEKQVDGKDENNTVEGIVRYLKVSKIFKESLVKKDLLNAEKLKRYLDAEVTTAKND